tara:strand:- start:134 stop:955 length:822 start_codon:yes stop_codon:yes gene_type:complete
MPRKAFTLLELLAVIAIVALLIAILFPVLSSVKQTSSELVCLTRIRNASFAVTQYTDQNRGFLPFAGYTVNTITNPALESIRVGGTNGFSHSQWVNIMPEYWTGDLWPQSMMCPDQPPYDPTFTGQWPNVDLLTDGFRRQPLFDLSGAFHITPQSLTQNTEYNNLIVQPQRLHNVTFPSSKTLLYEFFGFCVETSPEVRFWQSAAQTQLFATSTVAVDGSAFRYATRNAIEPAFGAGFDLTMNGIQGRDIDHTLINKDALDRLSYSTWYGEKN